MLKYFDQSACRASVLLNICIVGLSIDYAIWDEQRPADVFLNL
jgi:hypothetical protein